MCVCVCVCTYVCISAAKSSPSLVTEVTGDETTPLGFQRSETCSVTVAEDPQPIFCQTLLSAIRAQMLTPLGKVVTKDELAKVQTETETFRQMLLRFQRQPSLIPSNTDTVEEEIAQRQGSISS